MLRSPKWGHGLIAAYLWRTADQHVADLEARGETSLMIWDGSAWEKPESVAAEGLCAVLSRKAERLKHIRPGFYRPPAGQKVLVPGLHWLALLVTGLQRPPHVAAMEWWTTRGKWASDQRSQEANLLQRCAQAWGTRVLHIFDRGFAGGPWLTCLAQTGLRFVVRWNRGYTLQDLQGNIATPGALVRYQRSWEQRNLWDYRRGDWCATGVVAIPVCHPAYAAPLWLVVARQKRQPHPWFLLTNQPVTQASQAWPVVMAYMRRWQVETAFRFTKSELAIESPRLWFWDNRLKLLMIVTLVYAFLLHLLIPEWREPLHLLLHRWAHRTGKHLRQTSTPLYRLRSALSRLWLAFPPPAFSFLNSG